jgi:hypothetical protein
MTRQLRPNPAEFERCVQFLCTKIETIAMRSGMTDADCADLERTLAAMPPLARDRVKLMLHGIDIHTEYDDPVMAFAARYIVRLAQEIWAATPHPLTHPAPSAAAFSRAS